MANEFRLLDQETRLVPIDSIQPHERNVNQGDVGAISVSIDANGFFGTVLAQKSTGKILAGKHRWIAAKQAGAKKLPVTFVNVDDATALRIMLADNRTTRLGLDDPQALVELLQEIQQDQGTLAGTGYDADAIQAILKDINRDLDKQKSPEDFDSYDDSTIATDYHCPKCGYEWSGKAK
jgi:ParB-like chromosome segregation protein Spo0J